MSTDWTIEQKLLDLYYRKKDGCEHKGAGRVCIDCVAEMVRAEGARASQESQALEIINRGFWIHGYSYIDGYGKQREITVLTDPEKLDSAERDNEFLRWEIPAISRAEKESLSKASASQPSSSEIDAWTQSAALKNLDSIILKCEQYWNEAGICDDEIHAILENIHRHARHVRDALAAPATEGEKP